ncbi:CARDB domain-containing protein [Bacillus altitudinis]|uniref:CARDB domain-containing protein n=1 Tax=Bacillus altitudinis TaxID=293387 RepID=UPI002F9282D1
MKSKFILLSALTLLFSLFIPDSFSTAHAATSRVILKDYGVINKEMNWEDPKWVKFPNEQFGNYPSSIEYDQDGYTGTLKATKIKLTPLEKKYHKDPVYKTVSKTFTKTVTKDYKTKSNTNIPDKLYINEDGYQGYIDRSSVAWTTNTVKNRTKTITDYWTDSNYKEFSKDAKPPKTLKGTYTDNKSNKTINYSLAKSGSIYSSDSKKEWVFYRAPGAARWYDKEKNYYLGFMSNNPTSYYAGKWTDKKPGEAPDKYYGIPRELTNKDWVMVDYGWDESKVQDAADWKSVAVYSNGNYYWKSESGVLNKYRRGVWIDYKLNVKLHKWKQKYQSTVKLPNYIEDYTAKTTYKGKLTKQVLEKYNEYYTSSKWRVEVQYEGKSYGTNLTAKTLDILDINEKKVKHLTKGHEYYAKISYKNTGETDVGKHYVSLSLKDKVISNKQQDALLKGESRTVLYKFKANEDGTNKYDIMVDSKDEIKETNELDNELSIEKQTNNPPEIRLTYEPSEIWEGDNVKVCVYPTDPDDDPLDVTLYMNNAGNQKKLISEKKVKSGSTLCTDIKKVNVDVYNLRATVSDGKDSAEVTGEFKPRELTLLGDVAHTEHWTKIHEENMNGKYDFYSGEKFLLNAIVSPYPVEYVTTDFQSLMQNGKMYKKTVQLIMSEKETVYIGEIYDEIFFDKETSLLKGDNVSSFRFTVKYANGIIKHYQLQTNIIGNVFEAYRLHRIY